MNFTIRLSPENARRLLGELRARLESTQSLDGDAIDEIDWSAGL